MFGAVPSDPTISRLVTVLAADALAAALDQVPAQALDCAVDADGQVREGACVSDATRHA